uniref:E3 ubiquitin-protein ligase RMA n=1 Tax=Cajanus cajan TaxID=3821 RepID=A0A151SF83_CAJCA|nr:RING finger protein 185 family [Cajanus cajan]
MASDQYLEEDVPQLDSFEDKSSLETWKCASDDTADSAARNASTGFDCNICLECVQDPVVTLCGHLYCWACIYKWLNFHGVSSENEEKQQCPVCKSEISESSLVPLYGRGQTAVPSTKSKGHQVGIVIPRRPLGGSPINAFDTSYGVFGEMIYARVFGNQMTNIYTYPNSYDGSGRTNPRINRHIMQVDRSLSRICFFLLCCIVLCLLLF